MSTTLSDKIEALVQSFDKTQSIPTTQTQKESTSHDDDSKTIDKAAPRPRILIADKLGLFVEETLKQNDYDVLCDSSLSGDPLKNTIITFQPNIIVVRSTKITKQHLLASSTLALIIRAGAGINTIDVHEASNMGIFVANCPGKNAIAVAELVIGHLINLDRRISDNVIELRQGKWNKKLFSKSKGLFGNTIAVLGIGNIGKEVCKRAIAFGMNVNGYSRSLNENIASELGINYCKSISEACIDADVISIHLPHNNNTHYIINKNILNKLKYGTFIINTSRGGVVNENDMFEMIKIKGLKYATDVYENEPKSNDKIFYDENILINNNIYGTHHIGASTQQASNAVGNEILKIIKIFLNDGYVENCVNLEKYTPAKYSLTIRHKDVCGVLAAIFDILKNNNINVQEMGNIVFKGAKSACATMKLDVKPDQKMIQEIKNLNNVYGVEISAI